VPERFTLLTELGRGGMGVVWKARDEETGQIVALKLLHAAFTVDADYVTRFERELDLAKRIHSAHVVEVLGFGARDGVPYLSIEYVEGTTLRERLASHGPYSWPEAKDLLIQITQGLADAHAAGVIHRDLKPSNVLIGPDGVAKLADFGIAKGLDLTRMTGTSTLLGTPAYLAPEGPIDERSDLYSLGIIAFELLTGAAPFAGSTYQEVIVRHIREAPDLTKLPPEARNIVGWLLAKEPAQRPHRASQLMAALYGAVPAPKAAVPTAGSVAAESAPMHAPVEAPVPFVESQALRPVAVPTDHRVRRKSTPIVVGLGAVGLVVCLVAVVLAVGIVLAGGTSTATPLAKIGRGTFSPTGSMVAERESHIATLLTDGRVLIAGGWNGSDYFASAELYDPKTGAFSSTGSMATIREGDTATLLSDGRVLIAGGRNGSAAVASAELYDPATGAFSSIGSMATSRAGPTATLLSDGRVLIAGGWNGSDRGDVASAELYDPKTGAFSSTGSMATSREEHTATLLSDGRVLIAGGWNGSAAVASAELYDPKTGAFSSTGSMATIRHSHTATLLSDGRVLIAGGWNGSAAVASAELYDLKTGAFSSTGSMATSRVQHTATLLSDGRVLIAGGASGSGHVASAELYDPKTGAFSSTGSMATSRVQHTATLLSDGRVLIAGGWSGSAAVASAELYRP
jgi:acetyl-CoA carboxylase carboxyltransferase component